jgi:hypothetical protein
MKTRSPINRRRPVALHELDTVAFVAALPGLIGGCLLVLAGEVLPLWGGLFLLGLVAASSLVIGYLFAWPKAEASATSAAPAASSATPVASQEQLERLRDLKQLARDARLEQAAAPLRGPAAPRLADLHRHQRELLSALEILQQAAAEVASAEDQVDENSRTYRLATGLERARASLELIGQQLEAETGSPASRPETETRLRSLLLDLHTAAIRAYLEQLRQCAGRTGSTEPVPDLASISPSVTIPQADWVKDLERLYQDRMGLN